MMRKTPAGPLYARIGGSERKEKQSLQLGGNPPKAQIFPLPMQAASRRTKTVR